MAPSTLEALSAQIRTQADATEQLKRIESRRTALQDALRALDLEEIQVKRVLNSMTCINRLPSELLVAIFKLDAGDPTIMGGLGWYMQWVRLMLVCTYWREVGCTTPTLWSSFGIASRAPAWLDLCLARSAETKLRISLFGKPSAKMIQKLYRHTARIEALSIHNLEDLPSLSQLFRRFSMPILRDLEVRVDVKNKVVDLQLPPAHLPTLQYLHLSGVGVPSYPALYTGLRRLTLCDRGWSRALNLAHILNALRSTTQLEDLTIIDLLQKFPVVDSPADPVTLPCLRSFYISERWPIHISSFITHLRIPTTCYVTIFAVPEVEDFDMEFVPLEETPTIASLLPANRHEVLPMLSSTTAVEVLMDELDYTLQGRSTASVEDRRGTVLLGLVSKNFVSPHDWEAELGLGLQDFLTVFDGAPVTHLRVTGSHKSADYISDHWREVFETFPALHALELSGFGSVTRVWEGLSMASPGTTNAVGGSPHDHVACPNLREVIIDGRDMVVSRRFFDKMLDCLRHRSRRGARLETLRLRLSADQENFDRLKDRYLPRVKALVRNVTYELYDT